MKKRQGDIFRKSSKEKETRARSFAFSRKKKKHRTFTYFGTRSWATWVPRWTRSSANCTFSRSGPATPALAQTRALQTRARARKHAQVPGGSLTAVLKQFGGVFDDEVLRKYLADCLRGPLQAALYVFKRGSCATLFGKIKAQVRQAWSTCTSTAWCTETSRARTSSSLTRLGRVDLLSFFSLGARELLERSRVPPHSLRSCGST